MCPGGVSKGIRHHPKPFIQGTHKYLTLLLFTKVLKNVYFGISWFVSFDKKHKVSCNRNKL